MLSLDVVADRTVLFVTHDFFEAVKIADRIAIIPARRWQRYHRVGHVEGVTSMITHAGTNWMPLRSTFLL